MQQQHGNVLIVSKKKVICIDASPKDSLNRMSGFCSHFEIVTNSLVQDVEVICTGTSTSQVERSAKLCNLGEGTLSDYSLTNPVVGL